jgi:exopolysaccharide production protein ExoQ
MPSSLASCLCIAIILWLLYRSCRTSRYSSSALWLPFLWFGIMASKNLACWIPGGADSAGTSTALEGSPIDRNVSFAMILLGGVILLQRSIDWGMLFKQQRWIWVLAIYLLISVGWSDFPFVSFKRWFKDFGNIVMILLIITDREPSKAVQRVLSVCPYVLVPLSVLFVKYYADIGRYYDQWLGTVSYCGVTTNKNALGALAMLSGLFLLWRLAETRIRPVSRERNITMLVDVFVLIVCIWLLMIARSATSIACFGIGAAVFIASYFRWVKANLRRLSWYAGGLILLSLLLLVIPDLRKLVVGGLGRDITLTDRTVIWEAVWKSRTNPLVGTGFSSYWLRDDAFRLAQTWVLTEAHNGYLETYLNSGLIGLAFLFAVLVTAGKNAIRQIASGSSLGHLYLALFLSGLIYNYTEATFNVNHCVGFCLWLIAAQYGQPTTSSESGRELDQLLATTATDAPHNEQQIAPVFSPASTRNA